MILDQVEQLWRDFIRKSLGRVPTYLLCSPDDAIAIRDELTALQFKQFGYLWRAADGTLRMKSAVVIEHPDIKQMTFVWSPIGENV